jgi:hypothetical protein
VEFLEVETTILFGDIPKPRNALSNRFDREMLIELLDIDKIDLDFLIAQCNYSRELSYKSSNLIS